MQRNSLLVITSFVVALVFMSGCSTFRKPRPGEPGSSEKYELAWVNPRIIKADQYITLITAERLDSFVVARDQADPEGSATLAFTVDAENCLTRAELRAAYGSYRVPLLNETLDPGVYKLSVSLSRFSSEELPSGQYSLVIQTCDQTRQARFFRE